MLGDHGAPFDTEVGDRGLLEGNDGPITLAAAQMGEQYLSMLRTCEAAVSRNVTTNLYDRHLKPLFIEG